VLRWVLFCLHVFGFVFFLAPPFPLFAFGNYGSFPHSPLVPALFPFSLISPPIKEPPGKINFSLPYFQWFFYLFLSSTLSAGFCFWCSHPRPGTLFPLSLHVPAFLYVVLEGFGRELSLPLPPPPFPPRLLLLGSFTLT